MKPTISLLALLLVSLVAVAQAVPPAHDTRTGTVLSITEDPLNFDGIADISSKDDKLPPVGSLGIDSTNFFPVVGVNWSFEVSDSVQDWKWPSGIPPVPPAKPNGAHNLVMYLRGKHLVAPHAGETAPNKLPLKRGIALNLPWWAWNDVACRTFHEKHGPKHYDSYGAMAHKDAIKGNPNSITGPVEIVAMHRTESQQTLPFQLTDGGSSGGGAKASYDAPAHNLRLQMGMPDIMNGDGSLLPGIDPAYAGDGILGTTLLDIVLPYQGPTGDGGFRFGPGHVEAIDPAGAITLSGDFSEYIIRDTSRTGPIDSYALFDTLSASSAGSCESTFINDFIRTDMMGLDLAPTDLQLLQGVMLTFVTSQNLATLTAGLNVSAMNVPATIVITGAQNASGTSAVEPLPDFDRVITSVRSTPNPFTRATTIQYELAHSTPVTVEVFDPLGRLVRRLVDQDVQAAGAHQVEWDSRTENGSDAAAGIYFYRVIGGTNVQGNRFVLVR